MRMDVERFVKISRNNVPDGRRFPGYAKRRCRDLIHD